MARISIVAALVLLAGGCAASAVDGRAAASSGAATAEAGSLRVVARPFESTEVLVKKSMPPQFELLLVRRMPTPGWTFDVEDVRVDRAERRIVARVRERGPSGAVAQVMTDTTCRVPIGTLAPGAWFFELWLARGDGARAPADAFVLVAR